MVNFCGWRCGLVTTVAVLTFGAPGTAVAAGGPPPGATALCRDGTYSHSMTHSGSCSHHGGVAEWLAGSRARATAPVATPKAAVPKNAAPKAAAPKNATHAAHLAVGKAAARLAKTALTRLRRLRTRALHMFGYERTAFGPAWADVNENGCDTRDDILRRDLTSITYRPGSSCTIASGVLHDPYTGKTIHFVRGIKTSTAVQIDHVVALGDAWATGAAAWTPAKREQYANDPLVLLAVDGPANEAKGDSDAARWLPPDRAFDCTYVERQVQIKAKYGLWMTTTEKAAVVDTLARCA